jgi:hypothetical protein
MQGVTKTAVQLWKSVQMYTEDTHNFLNCHNVAEHCKFHGRDTVVPNTATVRPPAVEIKMDTLTMQSVLGVCFG